VTDDDRSPEFIYALMMTWNPQGGRIYKANAKGQPSWVSVLDIQGIITPNVDDESC
jgi:hypothetical protein